MVSVVLSRGFLCGGGDFREEQMCLNHANEFPGVRFTKRGDCFSFFPPFLFTFPFIFILPSTSLHLPPTPKFPGRLVRLKNFEFPQGASPESGSRGSGAGRELAVEHQPGQF